MFLGATISLSPHEDKALEAGFYDAATVLSLPEKYGKRLRRTNSIEGLNEEIRDKNGSYVFSQTGNLLFVC